MKAATNLRGGSPGDGGSANWTTGPRFCDGGEPAVGGMGLDLD
jgi:hypothetical protein